MTLQFIFYVKKKAKATLENFCFQLVYKPTRNFEFGRIESNRTEPNLFNLSTK